MVLELENRCPPGHKGTLRMIQESCENNGEDRNKYCYPFKEYDPTSTSVRSHPTSNRIPGMSHSQVSVLSDNLIRIKFMELRFLSHYINMEIRIKGGIKIMGISPRRKWMHHKLLKSIY